MGLRLPRSRREVDLFFVAWLHSRPVREARPIAIVPLLKSVKSRGPSKQLSVKSESQGKTAKARNILNKLSQPSGIWVDEDMLETMNKVMQTRDEEKGIDMYGQRCWSVATGQWAHVNIAQITRESMEGED